MTAAVLVQSVTRRRVAIAWWCAGLVGIAALLAVAYPTVRDNVSLDRTFENLPPSVLAALGLDSGNTLTSPIGYLNSQFFANILPVMFLVFALGFAAWAVSGDEAAGTLELLLSNPVSRARVALERVGALVLLLALLTAVTAATLVVLAPATGLTAGADAAHLTEATLASALLALTYAAVAFGLGAAGFSRGTALAVASAAAVAGYVVQGLAEQVPLLRPLRAAMPWHWLIDGNPLRDGLIWQTWVLPLAVSAVLITTGTLLFARRDLR